MLRLLKMRFTIKSIAAAILLTSMAIGTPVNTITAAANATMIEATATNSPVAPQAEGWAEFCDDTDCTQNCGISVAIDNPGFLKEVGRKSVKFNDIFTFGAEALLAPPGETSDCEFSCIYGIPGDQETCINLEDYPAHSFRFIKGGCPETTC